MSHWLDNNNKILMSKTPRWLQTLDLTTTRAPFTKPMPPLETKKGSQEKGLAMLCEIWSPYNAGNYISLTCIFRFLRERLWGNASSQTAHSRPLTTLSFFFLVFQLVAFIQQAKVRVKTAVKRKSKILLQLNMLQQLHYREHSQNDRKACYDRKMNFESGKFSIIFLCVCL